MREHLKAGTIERITGRAHHSNDIDGYLGEPRKLSYGDRYNAQSGNKVYTYEHGITDTGKHESHRSSGRDDNLPPRRFQKLSPQYLRPGTY